MATQKGWAITGDHGLYTGWSFTRAEAIARHVSDLYGCSGFPWGGRLDSQQRELWKGCKGKGDRAVKVTIAYPNQ